MLEYFPKKTQKVQIADPEYFSQSHRFADPRQKLSLENTPGVVLGFNRHFWFKIYIKRWKKFVLEPICSAMRVTSIGNIRVNYCMYKSEWFGNLKVKFKCYKVIFQIRVVTVGLFYAMCVALNANNLNCFIIILTWATGSCGMDHEVHFIQCTNWFITVAI